MSPHSPTISSVNIPSWLRGASRFFGGRGQGSVVVYLESSLISLVIVGRQSLLVMSENTGFLNRENVYNFSFKSLYL